jgi:hypothetical protein
MTERATIRDAAFVAALWDARSAELRDLIERDPEAALEGFLEAINAAENRLYFLMMLVDLFSLEALEAAGAPESVLERKRMLIDQQQPPAAPVGPARVAADAGHDATLDAVPASMDAEPHRALTLSELLGRDRDRWDEVIAHGAQIFASQVVSLSPKETEDLKGRLDSWWPEKPYAQTIARESPNAWRQENLAAAWLWFGPPLDKTLDTRQWAELASCGILFDDQTSWLRRQADVQGVRQLAETCQATDSRVWQQALAATPDPLPEELVNAVISNLRTAEEEHYEVRFIGQRLLAAAGTQPLRTLSDVSPQFAESLRPLLAGAGDEEAQRILIRHLREQLRAHQRPTGDLNWLDTIVNEDLLDDLFACVELLWGPTPAVQETQTWFTVDVMTPVMNAIRNIGGGEAVERYDSLIAKQSGFQFLRDQRDAVAQAMLRRDGLVAAQQAAGELNLPAFAPSD